MMQAALVGYKILFLLFPFAVIIVSIGLYILPKMKG
jgi:hypothetical protein